MRILAMLVVIAGLQSTAAPGAKTMFYGAGDLGRPAGGQPTAKLRPVRFAQSSCGIHYWLEAENGTTVTESRARSMAGKFTVHLRNNVGHGFLTVWEVTEGRELTPREGQWSGYRMSDDTFTVPGVFEFRKDESAKHLVFVWARSQTEVAGSAPHALARLKDMPAWMPIVRESDESTPGEVGTYVVNRANAGVAAEILFRSR